MPSITARRFTQFLALTPITVSITSPTDGSEITTDGFAVVWDHDQVQTQYRLQAYSDEALATLVYDSQWTASAVLSGSIPAATLESGSTYWIKVTVATDGGYGVADAVSVVIMLPTANDVGNVVAKALGGDCGSLADPRVLPGIRLTWSAPTIGGGETFSRYLVYRRPGGETSWTRIASITNFNTLTYADYTVASRDVYEYAIVYEATIASGETLFSARQSPPPNARVEFDFIWLHSVTDPTINCRLFSHFGQVTVAQAMSFGSTWGREEPSAYVGEYVSRTLRLNQLDLLRAHPGEWRKFTEFVDAQKAGAMLCLRLGLDRERYFTAWPTTAKSLSQRTYGASVDLTEVHYDEAVS